MKRFEALSAALDAFALAPQQDLSNEFVQSGIIAKFSLQFELSWKLFKSLLAYEGDAVSVSGSPRDIIKAAFRLYDFLDEELWLRMLKDRNSIVHVYDADSAQRLVATIIDEYLPEFERMRGGIAARYPNPLAEDLR